MSDTILADDVEIHRAGLSTVGRSGEEVCGAAADPSAPAVPPTTSPTVSPTVSPSAPGQGPDTSDCVGEAPVGEQRWCLRWVRYTPTPPQGAPSHWLTACNLTRTTDEYALCQAVALTLKER